MPYPTSGARIVNGRTVGILDPRPGVGRSLNTVTPEELEGITPPELPQGPGGIYPDQSRTLPVPINLPPRTPSGMSTQPPEGLKFGNYQSGFNANAEAPGWMAGPGSQRVSAGNRDAVLQGLQGRQAPQMDQYQRAGFGSREEMFRQAHTGGNWQSKAALSSLQDIEADSDFNRILGNANQETISKALTAQHPAVQGGLEQTARRAAYPSVAQGTAMTQQALYALQRQQGMDQADVDEAETNLDREVLNRLLQEIPGLSQPFENEDPDSPEAMQRQQLLLDYLQQLRQRGGGGMEQSITNSPALRGLNGVR